MTNYSPQIVPLQRVTELPRRCYGPYADWSEFGKFANPPAIVYMISHKPTRGNSGYMEYFANAEAE